MADCDPWHYGTINPNFYVSPGGGAPYQSIRQYAYNVGVLGHAAAQIPPAMLGNPAFGALGATYNPYALSTAAALSNPYTTAALASSPYGGDAALSKRRLRLPRLRWLRRLRLFPLRLPG